MFDIYVKRRNNTFRLNIIIYLMINLILIPLYSCNKTESSVDVDKDFRIDEDCFSGNYFSYNTNRILKSIEIIKENDKYEIRILQIDLIDTYAGEIVNNEILIILPNGNEIHLYKNYEELIVYRVLKSGYQPEDIEWTLYKNKYE